jgi:DinB family protein
MNPRLTELLAHLDRQRIVLREAVDSVPAALRRLSPSTDRWSVAEVLEHLGLVERRLTHLFATRVAAARAEGRVETETSPVDVQLHQQRLVDRLRTIVAGEHVRPTGAIDDAAAWQILEDTRRGLESAIADADGVPLGEIVHPHPALGSIDFYQWLAFIGWHEARHAAQIREVGAQVGA